MVHGLALNNEKNISGNYDDSYRVETGVRVNNDNTNNYSNEQILNKLTNLGTGVHKEIGEKAHDISNGSKNIFENTAIQDAIINAKKNY